MTAGRAGVIGAIGAGAAGLGAWALGAFGGRGENGAQPAPAAENTENETEEQIYNRLLQEQPENFRNDVDVQNDARAEARLRARAGQQTPQKAPAAVSQQATPQSPPAAAPGTTHDIITGAPIGAPAAPAATRAQTPTPAATVNPAEAARAREEALNATAQRYQASVEEKASVERERAALEERYGQTDTEITVRPEPGSNLRFRYQAAAYSDPEAQRQHLELLRRESQAEIQRKASFRSAARNVASTRTDDGLLSEDADVTPQMIQALTTRYGYTSEQLQRYGGGPTQENFVTVGGIYYANTIRRLFDDELKKDLERRAAAAQQPTAQNKDASDSSGGDASSVQSAAVTPTQNSTPAATPVATPAAAPGTEYDIMTGMPIGAPAATRVQTPTPSAATPAATQQQIPEGATPIRSNGRVVGYMPAGGGPTVTFTDADRNTLEGARTQLTGSGSSATAAPPAATPVVTPNATPVATPSPSATTEQSSNELTDQQKQFVDYFLRYNELQDNEEARSIAEYIVKRRNMPGSLPNIASRDLRILVFNELRRRADRMGGMLIDNKLVLPGRPLTAAQMSSIERAGVQHYPQYVIDQYNRQKSGNATPEPASETSTAATQQQIPEGATPVRSNDRVVGYMPEGGGPTVTFTGADRQTLEGARTQLTGSGSSAPTPTVTSGRTFDQRLGLAPISERPATTDATRSQPTTELSERQKQFIEQFLRSRQKQNDNEARSIVENIVQQRNMPGNSPSIDFDRLNLLFNGEQLRRASLEQGTFIENRLPIAPVTPVTSTNTTTVSTQPSGSIRMGREIGESSRVAAPPPTATTPAPVANETEDQIYNRLLQEQPENFRNDVDVQNDARAEARLLARAGQTQQTATPEASGTVNPMTDPSGFNARILNVRAQEILFKADKFEYSEGFQLATGSPTPTPGPTPGPAAGGEGASSVGGSTPGPAPAAAGGSTSGATSAAPAAGTPGVTQTGAANITGLDFAAGVDQRIKPGIADKTKEIQSAFGKKLTVTSGFRDPARNSRVGGAGGSKHLTGDAVDVQFPGNQQETIDFIKVASEKGAGGIGVYRPGFLHIDTGAKRVWGPDYKATSIPDWAKPALDEHMGKPASQSAGGGAAAGGGETASPMPAGQQQAASAGAASPSAPAATPEPSAPSSGAAMSSASVADETASRPSAGPTPPPPDSTAPITAAPQGPSLPGIDPNNPGSVEPADAAIRYSRLFNIAA